MKTPTLTALAAVNAALVVGLVALWVTPQGQWRNVHWTQPAPIAPNYQQMLPALAAPQHVRTDAFLALVERPLFSNTRRPPPPPPPPAPKDAEPPADLLTKAKVLGIYQSGDAGGIIAFIDGKNRRIRLNETVSGWQLRSVDDHKAVFANGGRTRELPLTRADIGSATGTGPGAAGAAAPLPAAAAGGARVNPRAPLPRPSSPGSPS
jgi:hypothetical protein